MAQISTVSGIGELNKTVSGLNSQFAQVQSLSATSLIGHDVWLQGSTMQMTDAGTGQGAFQLAGVANRVQVQVLDGNNKVLDTLELGAQTAGRHEFDWSNTDYAGKAVSFKVTATQNDTAVTSTPLMLDKVESVGIDDNTLTLALSRSGDVPYSKVLAVH
jgi:flagellar basal-body rod modification protein FlgD